MQHRIMIRSLLVIGLLAAVAVFGHLLPVTLLDPSGLFPSARAERSDNATNNSVPTLAYGHWTKITDEWNVYVFYVAYEDLDNDTPAYVIVMLDNVSYQMSKLTAGTAIGNLSDWKDAYDGDYSNGEAFYFKISNLSRGQHTYIFKASDGKAEATAKEYVPMDYPLVMSAEGPDMPKDEKKAPGFGIVMTIIVVALVILILNRKPNH